MTNDLTRGSPLKQILFFSIPFLIGNLFQQFYNIADMVIVGRTLDALAYTAVGSTGGLVWFACGAVQSLCTGFSAVTARHFGAGDEEKVKQSFASAIKLTAVLSVIVSVSAVLLARPMLELLRTPDDIIDQAYAYVVCIFGGLVATALFNLLSNMIRALGDSRTPLYFLIIACVVNIILDFVFIAVIGMGTEGAGLATVIAQLISGLLCIVYIKKKHPMLHLKRRHFVRDRGMNISLLKIGIPMAFLNMVLSIGSIVMQFVTNGFKTMYITSQTTGTKIETFVTQPLLSVGSATAVYAAQNYGAQKYTRVVDGGRKALLLCMIWCGFANLILQPFGGFFVSLVAGDVTEEVILNAHHYIRLNTALSFVLAPLIVYKNILQSVGRTFWTMISGFTEIVARAGLSVAVLALLASASIVEDTGFTLMCLASPLAWLFGFLTIVLDYIFMAKKFKKLDLELKTQK